MDQHVAVGGVIAGDGGGYGEHLLVEHAVVVAGEMGFLLRSRVKAGDGRPGGIAAGGVQDQCALAVYHPDVGVKEGGGRLHQGGGLRLVHVRSPVAVAVLGGDAVGLGVERFVLAVQQIIVDHLRGEGGDGDEAQQPEDQVPQQKFCVEGVEIHYFFTSNL